MLNRRIAHYYPEDDVAESELLQELANATLRGKRVVIYVQTEDQKHKALEYLTQNGPLCLDNVTAVLPEVLKLKVTGGPHRPLKAQHAEKVEYFGDDAVEQTVTVPHKLSDPEIIRAINKKTQDAVLVFWRPNEPLNLSPLTCSDIYVFHCSIEGKVGIVREGVPDDDSPEDAFPALCDRPKRPLQPIVDELLLKDCIHVWAGAFESYKTMAAIALCAAILGGSRVFDHFVVLQRFPILFCCPDMGASLFDEYAAPFALRSFGKDFRVQRDDSTVFHGVDSPVLHAMVRDRILILDTMLDYAQIQRAFESSEWINFFAKLRALINVYGCVAIIMLVHPTKSGGKSDAIEPADYLKDSVTFGGKIDVGFAFSKLKDTSQIFVKRIKGRGFKQREYTFTLTTHADDGHCYLDEGKFPVYLKPGEAGQKEDHACKVGRKVDAQRDDKLAYLKSLTGSLVSKVDQLNKKFNSKHTRDTVRNWLRSDTDVNDNLSRFDIFIDAAPGAFSVKEQDRNLPVQEKQA